MRAASTSSAGSTRVSGAHARFHFALRTVSRAKQALRAAILRKVLGNNHLRCSAWAALPPPGAARRTPGAVSCVTTNAPAPLVSRCSHAPSRPPRRIRGQPPADSPLVAKRLVLDGRAGACQGGYANLLSLPTRHRRRARCCAHVARARGTRNNITRSYF